jgi:hypothetical protein
VNFVVFNVVKVKRKLKGKSLENLLQLLQTNNVFLIAKGTISMKDII